MTREGKIEEGSFAALRMTGVVLGWETRLNDRWNKTKSRLEAGGTEGAQDTASEGPEFGRRVELGDKTHGKIRTLCKRRKGCGTRPALPRVRKTQRSKSRGSEGELNWEARRSDFDPARRAQGPGSEGEAGGPETRVIRWSGDGEDDFAELFAFFQVVVGSDAVGQGEDFVDDGFEAALADEFEDSAQLVFGAHVGAEKGKLASKKEAQIDIGLVAGGGATGNQATAGGEAFDAFGPSGFANVFKDYIDAAILSEAVDFLGDGHDAVMNDFISADLLGFGEFFVGARGGDDIRTEKFGDLNGGGADATASGENQDRFGGLQLRAMDEHVPGGLKDQRDRSGLGPIEIVGIRKTVDVGATNIFGAAAVEHVAEIGEMAAEVVVAGEAGGTFAASDAGSEDDFFADVNGVDFGTDFGDFAGDIAAGNVRERNADAGYTFTNPEIEVIEGAGPYANEDFIVAEMRLVDVGVMENAGVTVMVEDDGFHWERSGRQEYISYHDVEERVLQRHGEHGGRAIHGARNAMEHCRWLGW